MKDECDTEDDGRTGEHGDLTSSEVAEERSDQHISKRTVYRLGGGDQEPHLERPHGPQQPCVLIRRHAFVQIAPHCFTVAQVQLPSAQYRPRYMLIISVFTYSTSTGK